MTSSQSSAPRGSQEGVASEGMSIDLEGTLVNQVVDLERNQGPPGLEDRRRKRAPDEPQRVEGEAEAPTQAPLPSAPAALNLNDIWQLMQQSMTENRSNFGSLKSGVRKAEREAGEVKTLAAKATTLAQETKDRLQALQERVAKLEAGGPPPTTTPSGGPSAATQPPGQRDWDQLGGDQGDTIVIGGFRPWADKQERAGEWEKVCPTIPEDLRAQIRETIVPASLSRIILIKIRKAATIRETRLAMFEWCKQFKTAAPQSQAADEAEPRTLYAQASKPFWMRQRDAKTTALLESLKTLTPEENHPKFKVDMGNGRILYERTLIAERGPSSPSPTPIMEAVNKFFPDATAESLEIKMAEIMVGRERARKKQ